MLTAAGIASVTALVVSLSVIVWLLRIIEKASKYQMHLEKDVKNAWKNLHYLNSYLKQTHQSHHLIRKFKLQSTKMLGVFDDVLEQMKRISKSLRDEKLNLSSNSLDEKSNYFGTQELEQIRTSIEAEETLYLDDPLPLEDDISLKKGSKITIRDLMPENENSFRFKDDDDPVSQTVELEDAKPDDKQFLKFDEGINIR